MQSNLLLSEEDVKIIDKFKNEIRSDKIFLAPYFFLFSKERKQNALFSNHLEYSLNCIKGQKALNSDSCKFTTEISEDEATKLKQCFESLVCKTIDINTLEEVIQKQNEESRLRKKLKDTLGKLDRRKRKQLLCNQTNDVLKSFFSYSTKKDGYEICEDLIRLHFSDKKFAVEFILKELEEFIKKDDLKTKSIPQNTLETITIIAECLDKSVKKESNLLKSSGIKIINSYFSQLDPSILVFEKKSKDQAYDCLFSFGECQEDNTFEDIFEADFFNYIINLYNNNKKDKDESFAINFNELVDYAVSKNSALKTKKHNTEKDNISSSLNPSNMSGAESLLENSVGGNSGDNKLQKTQLLQPNNGRGNFK